MNVFKERVLNVRIIYNSTKIHLCRSTNRRKNLEGMLEYIAAIYYWGKRKRYSSITVRLYLVDLSIR